MTTEHVVDKKAQDDYSQGSGNTEPVCGHKANKGKTIAGKESQKNFKPSKQNAPTSAIFSTTLGKPHKRKSSTATLSAIHTPQNHRSKKSSNYTLLVLTW